jgi:polyisoprenoid-binding protein YceI
MDESVSLAVRYQLDASQSHFTVQAFATGLLAAFGHNPTISIRDFSGVVQLAPETLADASLRLAVKARSLTVLDELKEKDRQEMEHTMFQEVLQASAYPEITFESASVTATRIAEGRHRVRIIGDLTLHGVRRNGLWILAQLTLDGNDMRAQGAFTLRPTDYGMKLVSVAAGALKLKDELKFAFDLVGHRVGSAGG